MRNGKEARFVPPYERKIRRHSSVELDGFSNALSGDSPRVPLTHAQCAQRDGIKIRPPSSPVCLAFRERTRIKTVSFRAASAKSENSRIQLPRLLVRPVHQANKQKLREQLAVPRVAQENMEQAAQSVGSGNSGMETIRTRRSANYAVRAFIKTRKANLPVLPACRVNSKVTRE